MLNFNFWPFPVLQTERLVLRQLSLSDDKDIYFLRSDSKVNEYIDKPFAQSITDAQQFIQKINAGIQKNENLYWGISNKNKSKLIGTICLWNFEADKLQAETGYALHPDFQGKGVMKEALLKVIEYGFNQLNLQSIKAFTHPENKKSIKLLEKLHFTRDLNTENEFEAKGINIPEIIFSIQNIIMSDN